MGMVAPVCSFLPPGPAATTVPSRTFCCAFSGMRMPPFDLVAASARWMSTRSNSGRNRFRAPDCVRGGKSVSGTDSGLTSRLCNSPFCREFG